MIQQAGFGRGEKPTLSPVHENLDTTMLYAEVADPLLQKDYYQGVAALDPASSRLTSADTQHSFRKKIERLIGELKITDLAPERKQEIAEQMQLLLDQVL